MVIEGTMCGHFLGNDKGLHGCQTTIIIKQWGTSGSMWGSAPGGPSLCLLASQVGAHLGLDKPCD